MQEMNHSHSARGHFKGNHIINPCYYDCMQRPLFSTQDFLNSICNKFHSVQYVTTNILPLHKIDRILGL